MNSFGTELSVSPPAGLLQEKIQRLHKGRDNGLKYPDCSSVSDCFQSQPVAQVTHRLLKQTVGHTEETPRPTNTSVLRHSDYLENTSTVHCLLHRSGFNNVCKYFPTLGLCCFKHLASTLGEVQTWKVLRQTRSFNCGISCK